jgi:alpha-D-ribose 1-methylphosphonate 5-triphosphate synthase subunit PhnH
VTTLTLPGFADPTRDAQACFRAVLGAMASPGAIAAVAAPPCPAGLLASSAAVLLCLADADTPVWLDASHEAARGWIAFHCGADFSSMETAAFVVADALPALDDLDAGTEETPEASATLILQVAALGSGRSWLLDGPGLEAPAALAVTGLPEDFAVYWAANRARFPRGIDLILCAGDRIAAIPRSVAVTAL